MSDDLTLAELVTAQPAAARVLERHELDYCCGGRRSLRSACAERGLDPDVVLGELTNLEPSPVPDWAAMGLTDLVDHLEATHHRYLHEEMPRLAALVTKVSDVHGAHHPELALVQQTYVDLQADLEPHLMKEERVLFPMIRELDAADALPAFHCGSVGNPIQMMFMEHDRAGELMGMLRALTDDYSPPPDACGSYRALYLGLEELEFDTHLHVHKENNLLFPAVLEREHRLSAVS